MMLIKTISGMGINMAMAMDTVMDTVMVTAIIKTKMFNCLLAYAKLVCRLCKC